MFVNTFDQVRCHPDIECAIATVGKQINTSPSFRVGIVSLPCDRDSGDPCRNDVFQKRKLVRMAPSTLRVRGRRSWAVAHALEPLAQPLHLEGFGQAVRLGRAGGIARIEPLEHARLLQAGVEIAPPGGGEGCAQAGLGCMVRWSTRA